MPQNVKGSRHMSIKGEAEDISRKEDDINKKKKSEAVVSK